MTLLDAYGISGVNYRSIDPFPPYHPELFRRYITWLNDASLEHGGRFVQPPLIEKIELLKYFSVVHFLNATVGLGDIGLNAISMLSGQLNVEDPWDVLVDEYTDW
ncbi:hypothetical protein B0H13DRAFT_2350339 [Mycena leptocephala]|nr:hypothetical protein B0H13DRAFT_2350339 [Mycena leptocephala]